MPLQGVVHRRVPHPNLLGWEITGCHTLCRYFPLITTNLKCPIHPLRWDEWATTPLLSDPAPALVSRQEIARKRESRAERGSSNHGSRITNQGLLVGTGRFELPTPRTPSECSTRLSHVPTRFRMQAHALG